MALVAGVNIPDSKRAEVSLRNIYGIGPNLARQALATAGIEENPRIRDMSEQELGRLREVVERQFKVEGGLRREVQMNIRRKIEIRCFQGIRHTHGLPVRGQRSRTNSRTRKGPRRTVAGRRRAAVKK